MNKELEEKLVKEFPTFFTDYNGDPSKTCLSRGLECGDGWFEIIWNLCCKIKETLPQENSFKFEQIKEKFACLRVYASGGNQKVYHIINETEEDSASVCEECGSRTSIFKSCPKGWIMTKCSKCWERFSIERKIEIKPENINFGFE